MSTVDKNTGELITADKGAQILQDYLNHEGIDPKKPPLDKFWSNYAGINKLKEFIAAIDTYNAGSKQAGEVIGVRVYKCRELINSVQVESVMMVPVVSAEDDLYPVRFENTINQFTPNIILEGLKPCPPFCDTGRP